MKLRISNFMIENAQVMSLFKSVTKIMLMEIIVKLLKL